MATIHGLLEGTPAPSPLNRNLSPGRLLAISIVLIFTAEMVAMVIIRFLPTPSYLFGTLLDGLIMTLLILPGLYFLQLSPLLREIKERTRAEQALWTSEELLRKVLELLPVGVWITDKQGNIVHGNPATQEIWGRARFVGMDRYGEYKSWWADSGKPVEPEEWAAARAINRRETILNEEIEIESFDGCRKIILNSAVPILDEKEGVQGAVIVNQDITQRRQEAQDLIRTNELLERVFFSVDTLIAHLDRDFNFVRVNETYARAGGHPADFFPGKNHFDLYPNEENLAIFRRVVETGEPFSVFEKPFEYVEYPELGVTYWDWSLQPVRGADGTVEGLVLSLVDVTKRKRAEIQLERQNQELRQLSQAEHRQRELAEGLVQATIAVISSLKLDQVLCSILEQVRKAIPFQGAHIVLVEGKSLRVASFLGYEEHPESLPDMEKSYALSGFPLLQQVCASLQPVMVDAVVEHPDWRPSPGMEWVRSYAAVPLILSEEITGIIELVSDVTGAFTETAKGQLVAFAAPAALALHNAQIYQAELNARQLAETLREASQALSQALDLDYVIQTLLDHLHTIVPSDTAGVTLLQSESSLTARTLRGYGQYADQEDMPSFTIDGITDSVIHRIISDRRSLVIPNPKTFVAGDDRPEHDDIHTWLVVPIIASDNIIGLVEFGNPGSGVYKPEYAQWAEAVASQAAIAIQNAWLFDQVRSSSERLQSLARKLVEIQENERYYVARELHDEAGQALSSLKISLGRLEQDPDCPPHMVERLIQLKGVADGVMENLHRLAIDLRPATLDRLGLVAALEQYAKNLNSDRLSVQFKALGFEGSRLPRDFETSIYRIVQEATTNVLRHARASKVGILLEKCEDKIKVFVEDDGTGFSPEEIERSGRLGLVGMRERAEMLGGSLTIESTPGMGTSIIIEVPDVDSYLDRR
jgi:PAS domain S-box-containing protein